MLKTERLLKLALNLESRADRNMEQAARHRDAGEGEHAVLSKQRAEIFINIAQEIRECVR